MIIKQLLEPDAMDRLTRIGMVKPEKRQQVEGAILMKAQGGAIQNKLDENALVRLIVLTFLQRAISTWLARLIRIPL